MPELSTPFYAKCTNMHAKSRKFTKVCNYARIYAKGKGGESRIKEASAEAIGASADEVSYRVTSGAALRDFFGVLT